MASTLPSPLIAQPDHSCKATPALGTSHIAKVGLAAAAPAAPTLPVQLQNVVPLFGGQEEFHDDPGAPAPDWPSAFQLIRDVGAQVRLERDRAQTLVRQSQSLIQGIVAQAEEAAVRAEAAVATASDAVLRADRAEARARLAEERAQQAEDRAVAAQAGEKEAQLWLRRLHASLKSEYDSLIAVPDGISAGKSSLDVQGVDFTSSGLSLSAVPTTGTGANFQADADITTTLNSLNTASNTLRAQSSTFGSNLSIVQNRQDFSKNLINILDTGSANLTNADLNEEAANSQALSTRQSLGISALSLANQAQQGILQLLR